MSTVQEQVYAAIGSLFGSNPTRVYAGIVPSTVGLPYAVYTVISDVPFNVLTESPGLYRMRVQLDVFSRLLSENETLKTSIRTAMNNYFASRAKEQASMTVFEDGPNLHRLIMDWSIMY